MPRANTTTVRVGRPWVTPAQWYSDLTPLSVRVAMIVVPCSHATTAVDPKLSLGKDEDRGPGKKRAELPHLLPAAGGVVRYP